MNSLSELWNNLNIFKHWPPLVRAYRQNAAGMNITARQKNYLKWGTIILVGITTCLWIIFSLPYFLHQADVSFFAYSNNYARQFFDHTNALHISEFIWRFVAQFYLNVPLTVLTVAFLVIGFCITSWRIAGPYTPFLLPFFFLTFPSPNPTHASIAVSLWIIMFFLWPYFLLFHMAARHRGALGPLIAMHLLSAVFSVALYHITGHWALMFSIAVVLVHLIGVPMALSAKEKRLMKIRLWDLGIALAIALAPGLFFWKASSYPGFSAPWYTWVALVVFALACVPGIVLQAYNNQKTYLYETARKQGKIQDGKPALAHPYHILLTLIASAFTCLLVFVCAHSPLLHMTTRVENAVVRGDYAKSLKLCDRYFQKFGVLKKHPGEKTLTGRYRLASYLRLSLLMEGELNNRFLDYSDLHEMGLMYPAPLPFIGPYDYSYIKTYDNLGLFAPNVPQIRSNMELFGIQNRFIEPLIRAQVGTAQVRLMQTTFYYAKKSFYCRPFYLANRDTVSAMLARGTDGSRPVNLDDPALHKAGGFIDQWVMSEAEHRLSQGDSVFSPQMVDYYAFLNLMEKRIDRIDLLLRLYRLAEIKNLPRYMQEAVCIKEGYPQQIFKQRLLENDYQGYRIGAGAAADVQSVTLALEQLRQRGIAFEEVTRRYNATYTYHYLFGVIR
ncbi:MAG: hypothetical protein NC048_01655 [Bacteroides sp.]|nr:hypothetical protein [Ruminococcus flavefaciens]MCM1554186.1 hypothetical protein [Bacteroides sp.]